VTRWSVLVSVAPVLAGIASGGTNARAADDRVEVPSLATGLPIVEWPVTGDSLAWFQTQKVVVSDGAMDDLLGETLALSGSSAIVGAPEAFANGQPNAGEVYVFLRSGTEWAQQQALVGGDITFDSQFGQSVALDGDTAIVGAPAFGGPTGTAYVFSRSGTTWSLEQEMAPPATPLFGSTVAVSGSTALIAAANVGGPAPPGTPMGSVYVYSQAGGLWTQTQVLQSTDEAMSDAFGAILAFQGSTAVIGAPDANVGSNMGQGAAYVFALSGSTFTQAQKLVASDGAANDAFGGSAIIDGSTVLVGAPGATVGGNAAQGAVYVFTQTGGTFTQQQKLVASDGLAGDELGVSVALAGSTAVVGTLATQTPRPPGYAYVFTLSGGTWTQTQKLTAADGISNDRFGLVVATDGTETLVGAPGATVGPNANQGAVYAEQLLSSQGSTCSADGDCGSGHCVDGVCCDGVCGSQCQACDVAGAVGTCSTVTGSPHGSRTPCVSSGPVCGGQCDGMNAGACAYPQLNTPCGTTCSGDEEIANTCDGNGTCRTGQAATCRNNLKCDATTGACHASCAANGDCVSGYLCIAGACSPGSVCVDGNTSQGPTGMQDCGAYACNGGTGSCNTSCTTVDDCNAPNVCDPTGACVSPPDTSNLESSGCSVGATGDDRWTALLLALPCLALVRSRASRRGPVRARRGSGW
jgi:hypothetical protein